MKIAIMGGHTHTYNSYDTTNMNPSTIHVDCGGTVTYSDESDVGLDSHYPHCQKCYEEGDIEVEETY